SMCPGKTPQVTHPGPPSLRTRARGLLPVFSFLLALLFLFSAQGYAQLTFNPSSIRFGSVPLGHQSVKTITLKNTGTSSLTVKKSSVTGAAFSISGLSLPLTLTPGTGSTFSAIYSPTAVGRVLGSVSLTTTARSSAFVMSLAGTGQTLSLSVSPSSTNFGNIIVGNSGTLPILLTNTGSASITVSQAVLTGAGFSTGGLSLPLALKAGKNSSFDVTFKPTAAGSFTGNIAVVSNATNSPGNASLAGIGVNPHTVALSWSPSDSQNIAGYDVYRSAVPGGPYNQLNSSLVASTSYMDSAVLAGQTYYYVTTAVNSSGVQSTYSDQAEAQVSLP
ncbi:MAG: choice-of-anchor D domain-containing protein, partial [Terriglobia bacterium]